MLTAIWKLATKRILKRLPTEKWSLHQERQPSSPVYELVLRKVLVVALTDLPITDDTHLPRGFADGEGNLKNQDQCLLISDQSVFLHCD